MPTPFNLAEQPWIRVLGANGLDTLSLTDVFTQATAIRQVACDSPLEDAAIMHLLLAITLDSDNQPLPWLKKHHDRLDLNHPTHPFGQYAPMVDLDANDAADISTFTLDFNTAEGAFSSYDTINRPGQGHTLTPAEAARLLLVRQRYSVGGILNGLGRKLGGQNSAKACLGTNYPLVVPDCGTLADTLRHMASSYRLTPENRGTFHFNLGAKAKLSTPVDNPGILDVLTYPARAILYRHSPEGNINAVLHCEGLRLEDTQVTPEIWPITTWEQKKKNAPHTPRKIHVERPAWRQVLDAAATDDAPGILAAGQLPPGTRVTLTSLAAYTSRIDGVYHQRTVTPRLTAAELVELKQHVDDTSKRLYANSARIVSNISDSMVKERATALTSHNREHNNERIGSIVTRRMAGEATNSETVEALHRLIKEQQDKHIASHILTHPVATTVAAASYAREPRSLS